MSDKKTPEDLLEFPCHYQFKAVGSAGNDFFEGVVSAVRRHATVSADAVKSRASGKGTYQSVSVMTTLHSYEQLTQIYAEIRRVPELKMLL